MVRVEGVEPSSYPWEGYIIAAIRYPRASNYSTIPCQCRYECTLLHRRQLLILQLLSQIP